MSLEEIKQIGMYGGGAVLALMTLIQISPIKLNPWSWIARCVGRAINADVIDNVNDLKNSVQSNKDDDDQQWADLRRTHILRFGDEIRLGVSHSEEHFDQILDDISKYTTYCDTHPHYLNDKAGATIALIKKKYSECLADNKFL